MSSAQFETFWTSPAHRAFVEALDGQHVRALRDILLLAALADDIFTMQERVELSIALGEASGLGDELEFQTTPMIDHIDDLYAEYEERGEALLGELLHTLGEEFRHHALRASIVLMSTHGLVPSEEAFALRLADLMGVADHEFEKMLEEIESRDDDA